MSASRRNAGASGDKDTWESVLSREVSRALLIGWPWFGWAATFIFAMAVRLAWPHDWITAAASCAVGAALAIEAWHLTHHRRSVFARAMSPATCLAGFSWIGWFDWAGWHSGPLQMFVFGGIGVCGSWNTWCMIRTSDTMTTLGALFGAAAPGHGTQVTSVEVHRHGDAAAELTGKNGKPLTGRARQRALAANAARPVIGDAGTAMGGLIKKVTATVQLAPGEQTAKEFAGQVAHLESAAKLPPGAVLATPDEDDASRVKVTVSDPRLLRRVHPWPGPSAPGASIAAGIRLGVWQDGEPFLYDITNHHRQNMGASGAGKSIGLAWNEAAETITRPDAVVMGIDLTKGEQTFGPLAPAMTMPDGTPGFAQTSQQAMAMLQALGRGLKPRTSFLAAQGLQRWREGCGLQHVTVMLEEVPDIFEILGEDALDKFMKLVRASRSAGYSLDFSLQRSDWTQMPTFFRGQLAKFCAGVLDPGDAAFGLSAYQSDNDCAPELWGTSYPGMFYVDGPSVPVARKLMPMRTWFWGEDSSLITAHCAAWPAEARPLDDITFEAFTGEPRAVPARSDSQPASPAGGDEEGTTMNGTDDDTAGSNVRYGEFTQADLDADLDDFADGVPDQEEELPDAPPELDGFEFGGPPAPVPPLTADEARAMLREKFADLAAERRQVTIQDLHPEVTDMVGRSRQWLYLEMDRLAADGQVREVEDSSPKAWEFAAAA